MNASQTCDALLIVLKKSNLNYSLMESPFSVTIEVKKSFIKEKNGDFRSSGILEHCDMLNENRTLVNENYFLKSMIEERDQKNEALAQTIRILEGKLLGAEIEVSRNENEVKAMEAIDFNNCKVNQNIINLAMSNLKENSINSTLSYPSPYSTNSAMSSFKGYSSNTAMSSPTKNSTNSAIYIPKEMSINSTFSPPTQYSTKPIMSDFMEFNPKEFSINSTYSSPTQYSTNVKKLSSNSTRSSATYYSTDSAISSPNTSLSKSNQHISLSKSDQSTSSLSKSNFNPLNSSLKAKLQNDMAKFDLNKKTPAAPTSQSQQPGTPTTRKSTRPRWRIPRGSFLNCNKRGR